MHCLHGDELHIRIHESGHALAALERGIPFVDLVVFGVAQPLGDEEIGGRVKLDDERGWRSTPARPLLEFALAGVCAERALLGHETPYGWRMDITIWRQAIGAFSARPVDEYTAILGAPLPTIREDVERWASDRRAAITAIARDLVVDQPLSEADVRRIVTSSTESDSSAT